MLQAKRKCRGIRAANHDRGKSGGRNSSAFVANLPVFCYSKRRRNLPFTMAPLEDALPYRVRASGKPVYGKASDGTGDEKSWWRWESRI